MSSGRSAARAKALKQEEAKRAEGGWGGGVEAVQCKSKEKVEVQLQEGSGHRLWSFIPR